jgi:hypothetical protein
LTRNDATSSRLREINCSHKNAASEKPAGQPFFTATLPEGCSTGLRHEKNWHDFR